MTGKALVPIAQNGGGQWVADVLGVRVEVRNEELPGLQEQVRMGGFYPVVVSAQKKEELESDHSAVTALFQAEMRRRLEGWVALADERLRDSGVTAFAMLGNDDDPELADIMRGSERIRYAEDAICELPDGLTLVSCGYSTPTPWHTPRELSEEALGACLRKKLEPVDDPQQAIFNFHCPPKGTHLDRAPKLDENLRPKAGMAGLEHENVGSTAVRDAIAAFQPLLGLHGHVHAVTGRAKSRLDPVHQPGIGLQPGNPARRDRDHRPQEGSARVAVQSGMKQTVLDRSGLGRMTSKLRD